jgi:hypothetical protein
MAGIPALRIDASSLDLPPTASEERQAVERVLSSRQFSSAPLLSAFLLYVCQRAVENPSARISEHEIGVKVFHRTVDFDPREDNIVRNYARQLRKRLQEYYAADGAQDALRIEVPKGGYLPAFVPRVSPELPPPEPQTSVSIVPKAAEPRYTKQAKLRLWTRGGVFLFLYSLLLVWAVKWTFRPRPAPEVHSAMHPLWAQLFTHDRDTFIVPGDTGFVVLQQVNHRTFSLPEYLNWFSADGRRNPLPMSYLEDQTYTSVLNLTIVSSLQRLPEATPNRFVIRAVRNLSFDDLRDGNAILLGSNYSNPWDELFADRLTFHFVNHPRDNRYWIVNEHPKPGESAIYESVTKNYLHQTYAVLAFLPNLNKTGHVLLIQGLDGVGTQAAADMLFNGDAFQPLLNQVFSAGKHLTGFELLIEASSLNDDSNATSSRILATRLYP